MIELLKKDNVGNYLGGVADVHYGAYSKRHFTSCFNKNLLAEYYRYLIDDCDIALVHLDGRGVVDGFLVAGENVSKGVERFVSAHRKAVVLALLMHPVFLVEKAIYILKAQLKKEKRVHGIAKFRLMSIAVSSNQQSKGVGAAMLDYFEDWLRSKNISMYGLSVRKENQRAISFYVRNGFVLEKETKDSVYYRKKVGI